MIDVEKPKWQSNYFTGMPAPACAITVLLPLYIEYLGLFDVRSYPVIIALYMLVIGTLAVSTLPTFSGKLLGERIHTRVCAADLPGCLRRSSGSC